jgi:hypothetical protein
MKIESTSKFLRKICGLLKDLSAMEILLPLSRSKYLILSFHCLPGLLLLHALLQMQELSGKIQHGSFEEPPDHKKLPGI